MFVPLNVIMWGLLGALGTAILGAIVWVMRFIGLEAANTERKKSGGGTTMSAMIKQDQIADMVLDAGLAFTLWSNQEAFFFDLWNH